MRKLLLFIWILAISTILNGQTTWVVSNSNDNGAGSLRDAIASASSGDTIQINSSAVSTVNITSGELVIQKNLVIKTLPVSQVTIRRNTGTQMRIFRIDSSFTVTLENITVKNGNPSGSTSMGGGIYNYKANLILNNCSIENNSCADGDGGGIHNAGTLTITNSAIIDNISNDAGGAIYNASASSVSLTNVTISGNQCKFGGGSGIFNNGTLTLTNCTFSGNKRATGTGSGGAIRALTGSVTVKNTLFGQNFNADLSSAVGVNKDGGSFTSQGFNMSDNASDTPLNHVSDVKGVNVKINALADNGGFTKTVSLQYGSPAINAGTASGAPSTDQSGNPRFGATDIGAYEFQGGGLNAPAELFAIAGDGQVELKWSKNSAEQFSKYYIYGGTSANPTSLLDSTLSVDDTVTAITGLTNGTLYYFRLRAFDQYGQYSPYSSEDAAVPVSHAGNAYLFDAESSQKISIPSNQAPVGNHTYTLEAWIKPNYMGILGIISYGNFGTNNQVNAFRLGTEGYLINYWWGNDLIVTVGNIANTWHHVAATFDGVTRTIYLDGVEIGHDTPSGMNVPNSTNLTIGSSNNSEYFDGEIDEVRMWTVARTESEINAAMNTPLRGDETGLVGLWHFDEPSGTIVYDASSYSSNGIAEWGPLLTPSGAMGESLPVELSSFAAQQNNGNILLNWMTITESNNSGWEVEIRGDEWINIGFVAGKGTTTEKQTYSFTLPITHNASQLQFRLKQIDTDGNFSYSKVLTVELAPIEFGLSDNYPNPFNPSTTISYQLKANSFVSLKVFDLLGREVKTLINEEKSAGSYSLNFSAIGLPSGVYFYKLTAGNFSETKKMTVMK